MTIRALNEASEPLTMSEFAQYKFNLAHEEWESKTRMLGAVAGAVTECQLQIRDKNKLEEHLRRLREFSDRLEYEVGELALTLDYLRDVK